MTRSNLTSLPSAPAGISQRITSPSATLYCLPPVSMIAYITNEQYQPRRPVSNAYADRRERPPQSQRCTAMIVELRDVIKSYGPVRALDGLSFGVERGEIVGVLGPNGAGKTSAIDILL